MAKPGPRPVPTKLLQMRGSKWARHRKKTDPGYDNEAVGPDVRLQAPVWLADDAKSVWREVINHLKPLGIIGRMDTNAFGRYCVLFVQWRKAKDFVEQHGQAISTKDTKNRVSIRILPQMKLMIMLAEHLLRLEHEFGMTPSARASFGIELEQASKGNTRPKTGKDRFFA